MLTDLAWASRVIDEQPTENVRELVYLRQRNKLGKRNQTAEIAKQIKLGLMVFRII